jgi:hypothetical protein
VKKGYLQSFEFMRIEPTPAGVQFVSQVGLADPVYFGLREATPAGARFANMNRSRHKQVAYARWDAEKGPRLHLAVYGAKSNDGFDLVLKPCDEPDKPARQQKSKRAPADDPPR